MDRYQEAGRLVTNFIESGFVFHPVADRQARTCEEFQAEFGFEALKELDDNDDKKGDENGEENEIL